MHREGLFRGVYGSNKGEGHVSSGVSAVYIRLPSGLLGNACSGVSRRGLQRGVKPIQGCPVRGLQRGARQIHKCLREGLVLGLSGHAYSGVPRKRLTAGGKANSGVPRDWVCIGVIGPLLFRGLGRGLQGDQTNSGMPRDGFESGV